jgi:superfamily II DNA or RNA helicase
MSEMTRYGGLSLRDDQASVCDATREFLEAGRHFLVVAPTASGKSFMIAAIALEAASQRRPVLVIQPDQQLAVQNASVFFRGPLGRDVDVAFWTDKTFSIPDSLSDRVVNARRLDERPSRFGALFATAQSLRGVDGDAWKEIIEAAPLVLIDEAHTSAAASDPLIEPDHQGSRGQVR